MPVKSRTKEQMPPTNEDMVFRYFKCIDNKDLDGIIELFDYDATIYEPFSKIEGLRGRSAIEPFLKVAMMANSNFRRKIKIEKASKSKITALVTFERGDAVEGKFTFEFQDSAYGKKIKSLHIEFP